MNPRSERDLRKFAEVRREDFKRMEPFRRNRREAVKQYVGTYYSDNGAAKEVPVNFLNLAVEVFVMHLAARRPAVLIETDFQALKPFGHNFELALNVLLKKIRAQVAFRAIAYDAMFGYGVAKVGINPSARIEIGGEYHDVGQPFLSNVDPDDHVVDMTCRRYEDREYEGNRYRMRKQDAIDCGLFDPDMIAKLGRDEHSQSQPDGGQKTSAISQGTASDRDTLHDNIWLWDLYSPKDGFFITVPEQRPELQLRDPDKIDWDGPVDGGPYHWLGLGHVPGSIIPLAPVANWRVLHDFANTLYRKLIEQSRRQKSVGVVAKTAGDDGETIKDCKDGQMLALNNPQAANELSFGGPSQVNLAMFLGVQQLFNWFAGNIEALAGLSPQSDTLGQDQLLAAGASNKVTAMQESMADFTQNVIRELGWYLWTDPAIELPLVKRIPGVPEPIFDTWQPDVRDGDFIDYNFSIHPYSMQLRSPTTLYQAIMRLVNEAVLPLAPMMQAQGQAVDSMALLHKLSKLIDVDLDEIVVNTGMTPEEQPVGSQPMKAPVSTRNYVRRNIPGSSREGHAQVMQRLMLGGGAQDSEAASLMR